MSELFQQARERGSIETLTGVKRGRRGPCPMCSAGKKGDTVFSHSMQTGLWKCWRGCGHGDVVALVSAMTGLSLIQSARHILGLATDGSQDKLAAPPLPRAEVARRALDAEARRLRETADAEAYTARVIESLDDPELVRAAWASKRVRAWLGTARGFEQAIKERLLDDALELLRGHDAALYGRDQHHPAMVAKIEDLDSGEAIGRHVTYLSDTGLAKASVVAPRKIWGKAVGGVWLTHNRHADQGPLFIAEGIETTLSLLVTWRRVHGVDSGRALAVLSLGNLQGGWKLDPFGRLNPQRAMPDLEKPALTLDVVKIGEPIGEVFIGVDHDMRPLPALGHKPGGGTQKIVLSATDRMEICAQLASYWWRSAGADEVVILRPPTTLDWNDVYRLREQERRHG